MLQLISITFCMATYWYLVCCFFYVVYPIIAWLGFFADEEHAVGSFSCGGTVHLTGSDPIFFLNSQHYYDATPQTGKTSCWWYVTCPAGREVQMKWLDVETSNEYVRLYDSPSSTIYPISTLRGNIEEISQFVSTRGGITLYLEDTSSRVSGRGFHVNVSLACNFLFVWCCK